MRHLYRNTVILLLVLTACAAAIYPPAEKLRKGRDLAGGTSLIYSVAIDPGEPAEEIMNNTIEVLKKRVDPNGLYEIAMVRQGRDRIEITMPLPTDRVKQLKAAYEQQLDALRDYRINPDAFERAMRLPPQERSERLERMAGASESRLELFQEAARAYDASRRAREAYAEAQDAGADQEELDRLVLEAGAAVDAYAKARDAALEASFEVNALSRALEQLSDRERTLLDRASGETVTLPSPRALAIERIKSDHPDLVSLIDETIAAHEAYAAERRGLDDANDLIRLLRGAGVLEFSIAVQPGDREDIDRLRREFRDEGPGAASGEDVRWAEIENIESWYDDVSQIEFLRDSPAAFFSQRGLVGEERDGLYYILLWDSPGYRLTAAERPWGLAEAFRTIDDQGRPAIGFRMDPQGALKLGSMTGDNVGKPMAIVLDDQVYSAPTLNSRISSNGIIQGQFTDQDIRYIVDTLNAGALTAKVSESPISLSTLAPELGADNLRSGFISGVIALIAVAGFMMVYYLGAGMIAVFALASNALMILGAMALARAAFTLPGIAGVILTFGMAVDANVLIYERIREELEDGADIKTAVRLGYQKVLSTILDANITNLIVVLVLYYRATQEIRGFAITLGIGIVCTLISSLFITRIIFTYLLEFNLGGLVRRQLPTVIPALQRVLTPRVNWLKLRPLFMLISAGYIGLGVSMIWIQRGEMLDNEFRGGTAVNITLASGETRTRQDIFDQILRVAEEAPLDSPVADLRTAEVVAVNPQQDGVTSDMFRIKTTATDREAVQTTIVEALGDLVATSPPLEFAGSDIEDAMAAPVHPILDSTLGPNINRQEFRNDVSAYVGGAAILLERLDPARPADRIRQRLEDMRSQPDFSDTLTRAHEFVVLRGTEEAVEAGVILVRDPDAGFIADEGRWRVEVAQREWELTRAALTETTTFAGVQSFSPQVAATFRAQAIVAVILSFAGILAYVWFRFGSLRYSLAAIVAIVHDVLAVVGLIAVAEIIYETYPGLAGALLIEPFKIDLGLIAALLTIIGYSLNDTIVILDRIRENRGKLPYASGPIVNKSINQTISRTLVTSSTTLVAVLIMYVVGGAGIRSFTYALICGVVVGTYSSIAIAAPLVYSKRVGPRDAERLESGAGETPAALATA